MKKKTKERILLVLVNLFFIAISFCVLVPVLYALSISLNAENGLLSSDFSFLPKNFTLKNYHAVFFEMPIMRWLRNSLILAVITLIISLGTGIPAAYIFSRKRFIGSVIIVFYISFGEKWITTLFQKPVPKVIFFCFCF